MKKFTKKKIIFAILFVLILVNIGILFINKNDIFVKTLMGLVSGTCLLYYILIWIDTLKSLKDETSKINRKSFFVGIMMSIVKSPKFILCEFGYLFGYFRDKFEKSGLKTNVNRAHSFDYILENADWIGSDKVVRIGGTTWVGNNIVTEIGGTTWVGNNIVVWK
ncbi:MAG: hypothetical protein Q4A76_04690 [Porphyromonadaceae bacterium]|nr:hypothetical protein [Porphyromonadaceae bacterium]